MDGVISVFFFFNDTATTENYTLSLHDALPICADQLLRQFESSRDVLLRIGKGFLRHILSAGLHGRGRPFQRIHRFSGCADESVHSLPGLVDALDRKSTRLNSSHANISYAVFCL